MIQKISTKQRGFRCNVRIMNWSGDDILTTYDPAIEDSVSIATKDLQEFWGQCIDEYAQYKQKPMLFGKTSTSTSYDWIKSEEILLPEFSVGLYENILIQPVPLSGG